MSRPGSARDQRPYRKYGAVIERGRCVLLVRDRTSNKWGFPKGHVEGRESGFMCAQREVREETGLTMAVTSTCMLINQDACYYLVDYDSSCIGTLKTNDSTEISELKWIPKKHLLSKRLKRDSVNRDLWAYINKRLKNTYIR